MSDVPTARNAGPRRYEIRVSGHLERRWAAWFDGMDLRREDDGTTVIHGPVSDQAALHGLLRKLNDMGVALVSVTPVEPSGPYARALARPADAATGTSAPDTGELR